MEKDIVNELAALLLFRNATEMWPLLSFVEQCINYCPVADINPITDLSGYDHHSHYIIVCDAAVATF